MGNGGVTEHSNVQIFALSYCRQGSRPLRVRNVWIVKRRNLVHPRLIWEISRMRTCKTLFSCSATNGMALAGTAMYILGTVEASNKWNLL